jgi:hypothetical protein
MVDALIVQKSFTIINSTVSDNIARVAGGMGGIYGDARSHSKSPKRFPSWGVDVMEIASLWMQNQSWLKPYRRASSGIAGNRHGGDNLIIRLAAVCTSRRRHPDCPGTFEPIFQIYSDVAVDAANPTGCWDEQNNLIQSTNVVSPARRMGTMMARRCAI